MNLLRPCVAQKDIFDISEVEYGVLEINGKISVMKKKEYQNVT
ncbi:YetF domain-containing protein [Paenibacillus lautus]|nr:YetF domain-containing protein [Paenibacillus lautus]